MTRLPRHRSVTGAFYAAHRQEGSDSHHANRTPLHFFRFSLAKTSNQGDRV